eukprot:m.129794 g.129794  ORF g.129794 m.129794 type:complete len:366 (-) comp13686_c0_seq1:3392-4489(-)
MALRKPWRPRRSGGCSPTGQSSRSGRVRPPPPTSRPRTPGRSCSGSRPSAATRGSGARTARTRSAASCGATTALRLATLCNGPTAKCGTKGWRSPAPCRRPSSGLDTTRRSPRSLSTTAPRREPTLRTTPSARPTGRGPLRAGVGACRVAGPPPPRKRTSCRHGWALPWRRWWSSRCGIARAITTLWRAQRGRPRPRRVGTSGCSRWGTSGPRQGPPPPPRATAFRRSPRTTPPTSARTTGGGGSGRPCFSWCSGGSHNTRARKPKGRPRGWWPKARRCCSRSGKGTHRITITLGLGDGCTRITGRTPPKAGRTARPQPPSTRGVPFPGLLGWWQKGFMILSLSVPVSPGSDSWQRGRVFQWTWD